MTDAERIAKVLNFLKSTEDWLRRERDIIDQVMPDGDEPITLDRPNLNNLIEGMERCRTLLLDTADAEAIERKT